MENLLMALDCIQPGNGQWATNYKYFATLLRITHSTVQYVNPFCELHANRIVLRGSEL